MHPQAATLCTPRLQPYVPQVRVLFVGDCMNFALILLFAQVNPSPNTNTNTNTNTISKPIPTLTLTHTLTLPLR